MSDRPERAPIPLYPNLLVGIGRKIPHEFPTGRKFAGIRLENGRQRARLLIAERCGREIAQYEEAFGGRWSVVTRRGKR